MAYWLMKSEPAAYAWEQLLADGQTCWDGVRNHQAAGHLRAMRVGELAFFYHSTKGREIVGVMEITKAWYPDPRDASGQFVAVDVRPRVTVPRRLRLLDIKADPQFAGMALIRQPRLSVSPVTTAEWERAITLMGLEPLLR